MKKPANTAPLAELLRPSSLSAVIGQTHLLGSGKPLRVAFDSGKLHSMILWGPPGVGKTTIANLMANAFNCEWIALSAVFSGVKDIRQAMELAKKNQAANLKTILFIDEIHRFNKSQQDALLPYTESGLVTLIGATTENPSFEVNNALLSRTHVYKLEPLSNTELRLLTSRATQHERFLHLTFAEDAINLLVDYADGDARRLLNILEQIDIFAAQQNVSDISKNMLAKLIANFTRRFDKSGDNFYDQMSALHKSVRGSSPDAALYWLCRMLDGGADPKYLSRRIIRMAWEDIGLADPRALQIVNIAADTYERLGSPEGDLALAQAVIYLSVAAKSNAGYKAYNQARAFVAQDESQEVPMHLRNAPTSLMKKLGHGKNYRYAHDEQDAFAAGEQYLPDGMSAPGWYQPVPRGLEIKISEKMQKLHKLNQQAMLDKSEK